jgi:diguanylate cyclase
VLVRVSQVRWLAIAVALAALLLLSRPPGALRWALLAVAAVVLAGSECGLLLGWRGAAGELMRHARTDHLTGLGNAVALGDAVERLRPRPYTLLLVDVDGMRWTNAMYGHAAGDELLHSVAGVLTGLCESGERAVRLAEDKFVLLLPGATQGDASAVAERVRAAMHGVAVSAGRLRVSIGCARCTAGEDVEVALSRADDALFAAKGGGGDSVVVQDAAEGGGRWHLRSAVESILASDRAVYSVYQRIVRLDDGATVGWEALSRPLDWPAGADVEALFLTAHRMGRGRDLDWRCRRTALWEASRLDAPLFVNVNVAGLLDPVHGVDQMLLVCQWAGRAPQNVVFELSERDAMPDLRRLAHVLAEYRAAGFRFALDDMGEGHTTLELVLAARPEFIKLARALVVAAHDDPAPRSAARAMVMLGHDIGSTVVAEGVEDEASRALCLSMGVDLGQGWLFGRPQPASALPPGL